MKALGLLLVAGLAGCVWSTPAACATSTLDATPHITLLEDGLNATVVAVAPGPDACDRSTPSWHDLQMWGLEGCQITGPAGMLTERQPISPSVMPVEIGHRFEADAPCEVRLVHPGTNTVVHELRFGAPA